MMSAYHRDVLALLRDDYGVIDADLNHGGNHPRVTFTYDGAPRHITLNNKAFSPRALDMKRQDIRRLLGDPPPRHGRERKTLEEMMTGFNPLPLQALVKEVEFTLSGTTPIASVNVPSGPSMPVGTLHSVTAQGRLAIYAAGVRFYIPIEVANALGATEVMPVSIAVTKNDMELWTITTRISGHKRPTMHYSERTKCYEINHPDIDTAAMCGLSPTEYLVEGSVILVRCPVATRVPLEHRNLLKRRRKTVAVEKTLSVTPVEAGILAPGMLVSGASVADGTSIKMSSEDLEPSQTEKVIAAKYFSDRAAAHVLTATETDLRSCLDALRWIEATTPYRLGRRTSIGSWCFSAPRIE